MVEIKKKCDAVLRDYAANEAAGDKEKEADIYLERRCAGSLITDIIIDSETKEINCPRVTADKKCSVITPNPPECKYTNFPMSLGERINPHYYEGESIYHRYEDCPFSIASQIRGRERRIYSRGHVGEVQVRELENEEGEKQYDIYGADVTGPPGRLDPCDYCKGITEKSKN